MRNIKLVSGLLISLAMLSGCASSQMYAKDKRDGVYFTVPNGWSKVSNSELNKRESKSTSAGAADRLALVSWQEAYSKRGDATPENVFSLNSPKSPLVYVRVRDLSLDEVQSVSYNSLRDIIVPLTSWIQKGDAAQDFSLQNDVEVVQKAARGVKTTYSFVGSDGVNQTINQSSYLSEDHSKLFVLLVRASTKDYLASQKELNKIADSFTIRGVK
jgi:hypothetical protein